MASLRKSIALVVVVALVLVGAASTQGEDGNGSGTLKGSGVGGCGHSSICLYKQTSYGGGVLIYLGPPDNNWDNINGDMNNDIESWVNNKNVDAKVADGDNGNGDQRCLESGDHDNNMQSFNNEASSFKMTDSDNVC